MIHRPTHASVLDDLGAQTLSLVRSIADGPDPVAMFEARMSSEDGARCTTSHWSGLPALASFLLEVGDDPRDSQRAAHLLTLGCAEVPGLVESSRLTRLDIVGLAVGVGAFRCLRPDSFDSAATFLGLQLDRAAAAVADSIESSLDGPGHCDSFAKFDLVQGAAGLLSAMNVSGLCDGVAPLAESLQRLVSPASGGRPGWWVPHPPLVDVNESLQPFGAHANLGMAHGLTGVLAALSGAGEEHRVRATESMASWTSLCGDIDATRIPVALTGNAGTTPFFATPPRSWSWCYGAVGWSSLCSDLGKTQPDLAGLGLSLRIQTEALVDDMQVSAQHSLGLCHGAGGLYLLHGLGDESRGQIDETVASEVTHVLQQVGGSLDHLLVGIGFASIFEGAIGLVMARELAQRGSSTTGWQRLLGVAAEDSLSGIEHID